MQAERFVVFVLKAGAMPAPVHRCLCLSVILSHRTDIVPAGRSGRYVSAQIADRLAILKTKLPLRGTFVWLCTNLLRNSEEQFCRSYRTCLQYEKCLYQTIASSTPPFRALRELERGHLLSGYYLIRTGMLKCQFPRKKHLLKKVHCIEPNENDVCRIVFGELQCNDCWTAAYSVRLVNHAKPNGWRC